MYVKVNEDIDYVFLQYKENKSKASKNMLNTEVLLFYA